MGARYGGPIPPFSSTLARPLAGMGTGGRDGRAARTDGLAGQAGYGAPNRAGPIPKLLRILRTVRSLKEPKEHLGAYEELSVRNPVLPMVTKSHQPPAKT